MIEIVAVVFWLVFIVLGICTGKFLNESIKKPETSMDLDKFIGLMNGDFPL